MSGDPLTMAEAVPLGTVHLQRMLERVGVRSLVIKGPAFVELGVRAPRPKEEPPPAYALWVTRGARNRGRDLALDIIRKAPTHIPQVVWQQLTLDPEIARFGAHAHGVTYRSRWQILWLRIRRAARK